MNRRKGMRLGCVALVSVFALANASYNGRADSVHFYSAESGRPVDFGQVPQQWMPLFSNADPVRWGTDSGTDFLPDAGTQVPIPYVENPYLVEYHQNLERLSQERWRPVEESEDARQLARRLIRARNRARNLEVRGRLGEAIFMYIRAEIADAYSSPDIDQPDSHNAFLRIRRELLLATQGRNSPALQRYLRATYLREFWAKKDTSQLAVLAASPAPAYLRPFLAAWRKEAEVDAVFEKAKTQLSHDSPSKAGQAQATQDLLALLRKHPETPKRRAILGWIARGEYLSGQFPLALSLYRKQLAVTERPWHRFITHRSMAMAYRAMGRVDLEAQTMLAEWLTTPFEGCRLDAVVHLRRDFAAMTPDAVQSLQRAIREDPALLSAYIGFRLESTYMTPKQEGALYRFAATSLSGMKNPPGLLLVRTAQAAYNAGAYDTSLRLAKSARAVGRTQKEQIQRASFIQAASLARLGSPRLAIQVYRQLLASKPRWYLESAAREHLALLEERYGDPATAPEQYRRLGYDWDYAFAADAQLTPSDLARAARLAPRGEDRNVLLFTLGIRYMRREQYGQAEQIWLRLGLSTRRHFGLTTPHYRVFKRAWNASDVEYIKNPYAGDIGGGFDNFPRLPDPLLTTRRLAHWQRESRRGSANHRAAALYSMASYIYHHRTLLFYSPALWKGHRAWAFGGNWGKVNNLQDTAARDRHVQEHECDAQTLRICRNIIATYPHSKTMPKALYTAATSAGRLMNLNANWTDKERRKHFQLAIGFLRTLVKRYPNHPLAAAAEKYAGVYTDALTDRWSN